MPIDFITLGGGAKVATDKDGSDRHYQFEKIAFGAEDAFIIVADADGQRLPVKAEVSSLPALPTGSNTIGNVGVTGSLPEGTAHIGRVEVDAELPTGTKTIGGVVVMSIPGNAAIYDTMTVKHDIRNAHDGLTPAPYAHAMIDRSSSGDGTAVVAGTAGKRIKVISYCFVAGGDVTVRWRSAGNNISGPAAIAAKGGIERGFNPSGHLVTNVGEGLFLNLSAAIAVGGELSYVLMD